MSKLHLKNETTKELLTTGRHVLEDAGYYTEALWHTDHIHLICRLKKWPAIEDQDAKAIFKIYAAVHPDDQHITWERLEEIVRVYLVEQRIIPKTNKQPEEL